VLGDGRLCADGVPGGQDRLTDSERDEREDLAHHEGNRPEDDDLGGEHDGSPWHGSQGGPDRAGTVLGAHDQDAQDPEDELAEEDADQAQARGVVDDVTGASCPRAERRQAHDRDRRGRERPHGRTN